MKEVGGSDQWSLFRPDGGRSSRPGFHLRVRFSFSQYCSSRVSDALKFVNSSDAFLAGVERSLSNGDCFV